jgi:hypothetical protein
MRTHLQKILTHIPGFLLALLLVTGVQAASPKRTTISGKTVTPTISINPGSLSGFTTKKGEPSTAQSCTITATNIAPGQALGLLASYGLEFNYNNQGFGNNITFSYNGPGVTVVVAVRLAASAPVGNYNGKITNRVFDTNVSVDLPVSGNVSPGVTFTNIPGFLPDFHTTKGQSSIAQSVSLTISNLDNLQSVNVLAPAGFEVATNPNSFSSSAAITTNGPSTFYVRLSATAPAGITSPLLILHPTQSQDNGEDFYISINGFVAASPSPSALVTRPTIGSDDLETTQGTPSSAARYQFVAINYPLSTAFTVTAPTHFELSQLENGPFTDAISFNSGLSDYVSQFIYVRLKASAPVAAAGSLTGTIHHLASVNNGVPLDVNVNVDLFGTVFPGQNPPPPPVGSSYGGNLEGVSCAVIGGWVWDKNQPSKALTVEILDGNTVVATTTAGNFRQDLLNAGKGNGQHGFEISTPASLKDGLAHSIGVRVKSSNYSLPNSPKNLTCGNNPPPPPPPVSGNFDGFLEGAHCTVIGGWVWDKNQPDKACTVEILDGVTVITTTLANHFRQDLVNAGKGNGQHGFEINTPASLKDGQPHAISVRVDGNSFVLKSSPKSLNCSPNGRVATPSAEVSGLLQVTAFPNPVVDLLTVQSQTPIDVPVRLRLTTLTGLVFFETNWTSDGQIHRTEIPMQQAGAGLYLVETATPIRRQTIKVVKP